ncbi:MAG: class I SAM-dependent methyltransferase [Planctomycetia bacterium]
MTDPAPPAPGGRKTRPTDFVRPAVDAPTVVGDWYAHPKWYDLAFQGDTVEEADFVLAAGRRFTGRKPKRVLEPACGSGRVMAELARRGVECVGFDSSRESVDFARRRLETARKPAEVYEADLVDFAPPAGGPVDAAYCFCNTFRHLLTEEQAVGHLRSVARSLKTGGVYLLGLHLLPPDADLYDCEQWSESAGDAAVDVTFRVYKSFPDERKEWIRVTMIGAVPDDQLRLRSYFPLRLYTADEIRATTAAVPEFDLVETYDFNYDLDDPLPLNDDSADTVLVLRKK